MIIGNICLLGFGGGSVQLWHTDPETSGWSGPVWEILGATKRSSFLQGAGERLIKFMDLSFLILCNSKVRLEPECNGLDVRMVPSLSVKGWMEKSFYFQSIISSISCHLSICMSLGLRYTLLSSRGLEYHIEKLHYIQYKSLIFSLSHSSHN